MSCQPVKLQGISPLLKMQCTRTQHSFRPAIGTLTITTLGVAEQKSSHGDGQVTQPFVVRLPHQMIDLVESHLVSILVHTDDPSANADSTLHI